MNRTSKNRGILYVPVLVSVLLAGTGIYLWWKGISYDLACFMMIFFGLATLVFGYDVLSKGDKKSVPLQEGSHMTSAIGDQK